MRVSFDPDAHAYYDEAGVRLPNITSMLTHAKRVGILPGGDAERWFTEESRARGSAVHILTARYDQGALDPATYDDLRYRGWLLAYVEAMHALRPVWDRIEQPIGHPTLRFAGTPDRVGKVWRLATVLEVKSGGATTDQSIQTAMQAILVAGQGGLPAEQWQRLCLRLDTKGRFKLDEHRNLTDFSKAREVIAKCGNIPT